MTMPAPSRPEEQINEIARVLKAAWDKAEPEHGVTLYPASYMATFADMARAVLALLPQRVAPNRDDLIKGIDQVVGTRRSTIQRGEGHLLTTVLTDDLADAVDALYANAPTVAEVKADGWDEGAEFMDADTFWHDGGRESNPYRKEEGK